MSKNNYNDSILEQLKPFRSIVKSDSDLEILLAVCLTKLITSNEKQAEVFIESVCSDNELEHIFKLMALCACECALELIINGTQSTQAILLVINYLRK